MKGTLDFKVFIIKTKKVGEFLTKFDNLCKKYAVDKDYYFRYEVGG